MASACTSAPWPPSRWRAPSPARARDRAWAPPSPSICPCRASARGRVERMQSSFLLALLVTTLSTQAPAPPDFGEEAAARFAELALACVHREYPNKIAHVMNGDADARPPRELTPAFYGCFDWHSSVHGHWLLARVARLFPKEPFAIEARAALVRNITRENIAAEFRYMQ